ncbi:MAG: heavy metal translocating P-type ATPase [Candidatus Sumerlaeota bacterium]|nr:heavy metal translocating P-type ATPase [Candidatus Sumerlaeota bacterium]
MKRVRRGVGLAGGRGVAKIDLKIRGMDCAEEVAALKKALQALRGVRELDFDLLNARLRVEYDEALAAPNTLIAAVARTGMAAEPFDQARAKQAPAAGHWAPWGRTALTALSGLATLAGLAVHATLHGFADALTEAHGFAEMPRAVSALYLGAVILGGWRIAPKAAAALRRLRPDMNLLMTIAVAGAIGIGQWFEAATVTFLFALSLTLESWSVGRARRAIGALIALSPLKARVLRLQDQREELVDVERVAVGSRVIVRPGEQFPLDGRVALGETTVNQAPITGESLPVEKKPGSSVFAGTINGDGAVEFVTTRPAGDTTLARIVRLVAEAQSRRAPSEQWVERFARVYTPSVMALAVVIAVLPPALRGGEWARWFYQALVLLVIACPCALVISTPVSIVAALASAAHHGVLVKGGLFVEEPSRMRALALDKTGTLTEGRPEVGEIVAFSGHTEGEVLEIAAAIEARSEHPLGRAIVRHARARGVTPPPAERYLAVRGKGAEAILRGHDFWIGSHRLLTERGQDTPEVRARIDALSGAGSSVVVVGENHHVCGLIGIRDRVRPNARQAVEALRRRGVERIVMLTGDNRATAEAVRRETGIDEARAELLPEDKVAAVEEMLRRHGHVGMVGDGVNDAPAMARSSLGVAMGAAGTDVALETADVALMSDDLSRLAWMMGHARRTLAVIRVNIAFSLGVKAVFVVLAFAGVAQLWSAIAADMGVSLLVIFNALRLLHSPKEERVCQSRQSSCPKSSCQGPLG